jgi:hypothetical protein
MTLWETCAGQAFAEAPRRPIDDEYRTACLAKKRSCDAAGSAFADDLCLTSQVLDESSVSAANDCLAQACPDAKSCLRQIFQ